jgi:membrane protein DedA with SNARE-associated domain
MLETFAGFLDQIAVYAPVWGLLFVFVFMTIESSFIPFPSEVVMIPAGFLAARGEMMGSSPVVALILAIISGLLGSIAGAYINYVLALSLGKPFLEKYGKWFFIKKEALDRACEVFNQYGAVTTFVCRLVPVIRQLISIPAGISRMPLVPFTVFTALGAGIWTAVLAFAGFAIGRNSLDITYLELVKKGKDASMENLPLIIAAAVVLGVLYILVSKMVMGKSTPISRGSEK